MILLSRAKLEEADNGTSSRSPGFVLLLTMRKMGMKATRFGLYYNIKIFLTKMRYLIQGKWQSVWGLKVDSKLCLVK